MKKLIFKKGIYTIRFPSRKPFGVIDFDRYAMEQIQKVQGMYLPRKNVTWDYIIYFKSGIAEVRVSKLL